MAAEFEYTVIFTIPQGSTMYGWNTATATYTVAGQGSTATFSPSFSPTNSVIPTAITASASPIPATFTAIVPGASGLLPSLTAALTFYFDNGKVKSDFPSVAAVATATGAYIVSSTASTTSITPTSSVDTSLSTSLTLTPTPANSSTSTQSLPSSTATVDGTEHKTLYNGSVLAGVAVGCLFAGILLASLVLFLCRRRIAARKHGMPGGSDKQLPLLRGHGDALFVPNDTGNGWEKGLPQSDSDSTVRALATQTLDQIALHVENFYTTKSEVQLSTEDEFELENVDSSRLMHAISTVLPRSRRPEDLIKHCVSSYILAMIDFEDNRAAGTLLPKLYQRQRQSSLENAEELTQAYSRWRVLTAYLRQSYGDDKTYHSERNAAIDTAARQICRAFEPWAKPHEDDRLRNMVGIMRRASELGVLLFSQPARFEWQWKTSSNVMGAKDSSQVVVTLPGLYKVTDQNAMPLASPLRLVEPSIVTFEELRLSDGR